MAGTVSLEQTTNRLCTLQAAIVHPVQFGFGLLGRIEQGGHFDLERTPVDALHWKSDRISVHMQGRILLMKTLTREQDEHTQIPQSGLHRSIPGTTQRTRSEEYIL